MLVGSLVARCHVRHRQDIGHKSMVMRESSPNLKGVPSIPHGF
jgi:hypothetical protein